MFLAAHVGHLSLMVRRAGLEATMSRYLIDRLAALPNVEIHCHQELVALDGNAGRELEGASFRDRQLGTETRLALRHLFVFIGAESNTHWLDGCVELDENGYILTGAGVTGKAKLPLQISLPRIFAIATSARAPPSASPPRWARVRRLWPRSTPSSAPRR